MDFLSPTLEEVRSAEALWRSLRSAGINAPIPDLASELRREYVRGALVAGCQPRMEERSVADCFFHDVDNEPRNAHGEWTDGDTEDIKKEIETKLEPEKKTSLLASAKEFLATFPKIANRVKDAYSDAVNSYKNVLDHGGKDRDAYAQAGRTAADHLQDIVLQSGDAAKQKYLDIEKKLGRGWAIAALALWAGTNAAAIGITPKVWLVAPSPLTMSIAAMAAAKKLVGLATKLRHQAEFASEFESEFVYVSALFDAVRELDDALAAHLGIPSRELSDDQIRSGGNYVGFFESDEKRDSHGRWTTVDVTSEDRYVDPGERAATDRELNVLKDSIRSLPPELRKHVPADATIQLVVGDRASSQAPKLTLEESHFDPYSIGIRHHELMHSLVNPSVIDANGGPSAMLQELSGNNIPLPTHAERNKSDYGKIDEFLAQLGGSSYRAGMPVDEQIQKLTKGGLRMDVGTDGRAWTEDEAKNAVSLWRKWNKIDHAEFAVATEARRPRGTPGGGQWVSSDEAGDDGLLAVKEPPAPITLEFPDDNEDRRELKRTARSLFGDDVSFRKLAKISGALPGSHVTFEPDGEGGIDISIRHSGYEAERYIENDNGSLKIINDRIKVYDKQHRLGTRVFYTQIKNARDAGVDQIETLAIGAKDSVWKGMEAEARKMGIADPTKSEFNGYYTWPRFGYDGPLSEDHLKRLPERFRDCKTVQELLARPGGLEAWKEHGRDIKVTFDLNDKSRSMKVWNTYVKHLRSQGVKFAAESPVETDIPLSDAEEAALTMAWHELLSEPHSAAQPAPSAEPHAMFADETCHVIAICDNRVLLSENDGNWSAPTGESPQAAMASVGVTHPMRFRFAGAFPTDMGVVSFHLAEVNELYPVDGYSWVPLDAAKSAFFSEPKLGGVIDSASLPSLDRLLDRIIGENVAAFDDSQSLPSVTRNQILSSTQLIQTEPAPTTGKLIVFEGIDGAGKSSQFDKLVKDLKAAGCDVVSTKWNSWPPLKAAISQAKSEKLLTPGLFCLIHAADMVARYDHDILPALKAGKVVVSDRYYFTGMVRDKLRGIDTALEEMIYQGFRKPDIIFHCKVPVSLAHERVCARGDLSHYGSGMDLGLDTDRKASCLKYQELMDAEYERILPTQPGYIRLTTDSNFDQAAAAVRDHVSNLVGSCKKAEFRDVSDEARDAEGKWVASTMPPYPNTPHGDWYKRDEDRENRRAKVDDADPEQSPDSFPFDTKAAQQMNMDAKPEVLRAGAKAYTDNWDRQVAALKDLPLTDKQKNDFAKTVEKAKADIEEKLQTFEAVNEQADALEKATEDLRENEPQEPDSDDIEYPDEPDGVEEEIFEKDEPDEGDFEKPEEFEAAHVAWEKEDNDIYERNQAANKAYDEAYAEYEKKVADIDAKYNSSLKSYEKDYATWQKNVAKSEDKWNKLLDGKFNDAVADITDSLDEHDDNIGSERMDLLGQLREKIDAEAEKDEEPEEVEADDQWNEDYYNWIRKNSQKAQFHDVTGEARDSQGRWTDGGDSGEAAPLLPKSVSKTEMKEAIKDYKKNGIRARAFKAWFGDWENDPSNASKVVDSTGKPQETQEIPPTSQVRDEQGQPIPVYHGTRKGGFSQFDKSRLADDVLFGKGFYFTDGQEIAQRYSEKGHRQEDVEEQIDNPTPETKAIYLNIRKPFDLEAEIDPSSEAGKKIFDAFSELGKEEPEFGGKGGDITPEFYGAPYAKAYDRKEPSWGNVLAGDLFLATMKRFPTTGAAKITATLQKLGYDGVRRTDNWAPGGPVEGDHHTWVAFEPHQIKAVDNLGTFNPKSKDIYFNRSVTEEQRVPAGQPGGGRWTDGNAPSPSEKAADDYKKNGTKAKAFKEWFGDWESSPETASKVVTDDGDPQKTHGVAKKVYHGTYQNFQAFDRTKEGVHGTVGGQGFYFAENQEIAETYSMDSEGGNVMQCYLNIRNPFDFEFRVGRTEQDKIVSICQAMMPSIEPEVVEKELRHGFAQRKTEDDTLSGYDAHRTISLTVGPERVNQVIQKLGYDGIVHQSRDLAGTPRTTLKQPDYGACWIAFEPNQIKSVLNHGTFDPKNPNINFAESRIPAGQPGGGRWTSGQTDEDGNWIAGDDGLVHVYHGTEKNKVESIRKDGLKRPNGVGPGWYMVTSDPKQAEAYAAPFKERSGASILHFALPPEAARKFLTHGFDNSVYGYKSKVAGLTKGVLPPEYLVDSSESVNFERDISAETRIPAGQPGGGQWTNGNAMSAVAEAVNDYNKNGTRAKAFKAWFGDWQASPETASKVMKDGQPSENYHVKASIAVQDGKPVVVYHGSPHSFDVFDKNLAKSEAMYGPGFYFTDNRSVASDYARVDSTERPTLESHLGEGQIADLARALQNSAYDSSLGPIAQAGAKKYAAIARSIAQTYNPNDPLLYAIETEMMKHATHSNYIGEALRKVGAIVNWPQAGMVKAAYLNIRNPLNVDQVYSRDEAEKIFGHDVVSHKRRVEDDPNQKQFTGQELFDKTGHFIGERGGNGHDVAKFLQSKGFDGITHIGGQVTGGLRHRVWIAFEPNQIKSVDNRGTFDPKSDNVNFERDVSAQQRIPAGQHGGGEWTSGNAASPVEKAAEDYKKNGTQAQSFKNWFGDWERNPEAASKVVSPSGEPQKSFDIPGTGSHVVRDGVPIAVYHGTPHGGFNEFDPKYAGQSASKRPNNQGSGSLYGPGFYFTEDKDIANEYSHMTKTIRVIPPGALPHGYGQSRYDFLKTLSGGDLATDEEFLKHATWLPKIGDSYEGGIVRSFKLLRGFDNSDFYGGKTPKEPRHLNGDVDVEISYNDKPEVKACFLNIRKPFDIDNDRIDPVKFGFHLTDLPQSEITRKAIDAASVEIYRMRDKGDISPQEAFERVSNLAVTLLPKLREEDKKRGFTFDELREYGQKTGEIGYNDEHGEEVSGVADVIMKHIQAAGFDGITHIGGSRMNSNAHKHRVWIAFEPNQIKSVDNRGTFDPKSNNITFSDNARLEALAERYKLKGNVTIDYPNKTVRLVPHGAKDSDHHTSACACGKVLQTCRCRGPKVTVYKLDACAKCQGLPEPKPWEPGDPIRMPKNVGFAFDEAAHPRIPAGQAHGGEWVSPSHVISDIPTMLNIMADNFERKHGFNEEYTRKGFIKNWKKTLKKLEADPANVKEVDQAVANAFNKYDIPRVPVFVRKLTPEEKAIGEMAHWDNGFVVVSDDAPNERRYHTKQRKLTDSNVAVDSTYPDVLEGMMVHELGHKYQMDSGDKLDSPIIMNARAMLADPETKKKIRDKISSCASSHPYELVAEAYAVRKHPDFNTLPEETKELVFRALGDKKGETAAFQYDETAHHRIPAGQPGGGQWTTGDNPAIVQEVNPQWVHKRVEEQHQALYELRAKVWQEMHDAMNKAEDLEKRIDRSAGFPETIAELTKELEAAKAKRDELSKKIDDVTLEIAAKTREMFAQANVRLQRKHKIPINASDKVKPVYIYHVNQALMGVPLQLRKALRTLGTKVNIYTNEENAPKQFVVNGKTFTQGGEANYKTHDINIWLNNGGGVREITAHEIGHHILRLLLARGAKSIDQYSYDAEQWQKAYKAKTDYEKASEAQHGFWGSVNKLKTDDEYHKLEEVADLAARREESSQKLTNDVMAFEKATHAEGGITDYASAYVNDKEVGHRIDAVQYNGPILSEAFQKQSYKPRYSITRAANENFAEIASKTILSAFDRQAKKELKALRKKHPKTLKAFKSLWTDLSRSEEVPPSEIF